MVKDGHYKSHFPLANGEWISVYYKEGKTAFLPLLRKLRLCVVFEQALVEIILLAYDGLYFTVNFILITYYDTYHRFKFSLSTDDTTKKYLLHAGLHQKAYYSQFKILTIPRTCLQVGRGSFLSLSVIFNAYNTRYPSVQFPVISGDKNNNNNVCTL